MRVLLILTLSMSGCVLLTDKERLHDDPTAEDSDGDGDGVDAANDCDDDDPDRYPGADDTVGDDIDQNCDGLDGVDSDGDGHASEASGGRDCDDTDASAHPNFDDDVDDDGHDTNCDGVDGVDSDGDAYASTASGGNDCDDTDGTVYPGADDTVDQSGVDENCDGLDGVDADGDDHASSASGGDDCDDTDDAIHPGVPDVVDQADVDDDCDGVDGVDADGDSHASLTSGGDDCDDTDDTIHPGASDAVTQDDVDENCDGVDGIDADGDTVPSEASGGTDCDDTTDTVSPLLSETWYDGVDNACDQGCDWDQDGDGYVLEGATVVDGDPCDLDPTNGSILSPTDCDDTEPALSTNSIADARPEAGAADVFIANELRVRLDNPWPGATIELADNAGSVPGTTAVDDDRVTFTPDDILTPSTNYTYSVDHGCGVEDLTFDTSDVGDPVLDPDVLSLRTFQLDIDAGELTMPIGLGSLLSSMVIEPMLVQLQEGSGNTFPTRIGGEDAGDQDLCVETAQTALLLDNPFFETASFSYFEDQGLILEQFTLSGAFVEDGSSMAHVTLAGLLDTRPISLAQTGDEQYGCDLLSAISVPCITCPSDGEVFCVPTRIEDIPGPELPGVDVVSRSAQQITDDTDCPN